MLEKFTKMCCCQTISAIGDVGYEHGNDIGVHVNYSSILTRLIQEAGRYCEDYASDLFISWQSVIEKLNNIDDLDDTFMLFGFRAQGVDSTKSVLYHDERDSLYVYRSIWRLDIEVTERNDRRKDFALRLYRVR